MRRIETLSVTFGAAILFYCGAASAITIKPGKWEFRSTSSMQGTGAPREQVNQQCLSDAEVKPSTLMQDMSGGCELINPKSDRDSMSWTIQCAGPTGQMSGTGNVRRDGDKLVGGMQMTMAFNGQSMNMNVKWIGTFLGAWD